MELFISTTFIKDNSFLSEALQLCDAKGIRSVEIGSNHLHEKTYDYIKNYDFKYLIHNYFPVPFDTFVINIASLDDQIYNRSINQIINSIDYCSDIGSKLYTFHPGFLTDPVGSNNSTTNYDFQWDHNKLKYSNRDKAIYRMYSGMDKLVKHAQDKKVQIAFESEGSLNSKHLLMQEPEEYELLFNKFDSSELGLNLNIGHLHLASLVFGFKWEDFVDLIQDYIVAMELSHNDGTADQHLPLLSKGWYWNLILDDRFKKIYKILEYRNTPIDKIVDNIEMIKKKII